MRWNQTLGNMCPRTKILFSSGCVDPDLEKRIRKSNAFGSLQKPFPAEDQARMTRKELDGNLGVNL